MSEKIANQIKGWIQFALVLAFIAASFFVSSLMYSERGGNETNGNGARDLFVEVREVAPGPYRIAFETTGSVESRSNVEIIPQVSGRVISVNDQFFTGGTFKAEETLFKIDPRDFEFEVERLKAEVARAQTAFSLETAQAEAALAEWKVLNGDKKAPSLVARKPQKAEAWAALKAAKAQLETAKLNLERTVFSMPFDGRVLSSNLAPGQFLTAGQSYGQVFDTGTVEVRVSLEDRQLEWLTSAFDPQITITATYLGETKTYKGYLKRGASSLDPQTRFASVSFGFKDQAEGVLPGVFVDVRIEGNTLQNITTTPASALQKDGAIWAVDAENKLMRLTPDILYGDGETLALRGMEGGKRIVISKLPGATEGASVKINETQQDAEDE